MASRTFQHRVTLPEVVVIGMVAAVAFYFFMARETALSAVAFILICLDVGILERVIHTSYTFTDEGFLMVNRGRFATSLSIHVCDIRRVEQRIVPYCKMHYILIEYGPRKYVSILTDNEQGFMSEISRRQKMNI